MSSPANPLPLPHADDALSAWERALLDRQLETLDRLAEMGMGVAGVIHRRVTADDAAGEPGTVLHHAAMDFARVSRAVRMTLALQSRLVSDFKTPPKAPSAEPETDKVKDVNDYEIYWADGTPVSLAAEKRVLRKTVRELAEDRGLDRETAERLEAEALELMGREDLFPTARGPGYRCFHDMVALICEDLGLAPHLSRPPSAAAADGGGGPPAERSEQPVVVGENGLQPPFNRFPERPPTWSG